MLPPGRRLPYMALGVPLMSLAIIALPFLTHKGALWILPYSGVFVLISLFDSIGSAPYLALVPDIVPPNQVLLQLELSVSFVFDFRDCLFTSLLCDSLALPQAGWAS